MGVFYKKYSEKNAPASGEPEAVQLTEAQQAKKKKIETICSVFFFANLIAGLLYWFGAQLFLALRTSLALAFINLAIPVVFLFFYLLNLNNWDLFHDEERERMTMGSCVMSILALGMRAVCDFNYPKPAQLILPSLAIAAAGILLFFLLSIGRKKRLMQVFAFLLAIAVYAPSSAAIINAMLPEKATEIHISSVIEKDVHRVVRGSPADYIIILSNQLGEFEIRTFPNMFDLLEVGGEAVYVRETSILGVDLELVFPPSILN